METNNEQIENALNQPIIISFLVFFLSWMYLMVFCPYGLTLIDIFCYGWLFFAVTLGTYCVSSKYEIGFYIFIAYTFMLAFIFLSTHWNGLEEFCRIVDTTV